MRKALVVVTAGLAIELLGGIADVFRHLDRPFEAGWHDFLSATSHQIIGLGFIIILIGCGLGWYFVAKICSSRKNPFWNEPKQN